MKDYYNHRKILQELYKQDVYYGDLCGELLGLRDQNPYIQGMFIDMKGLLIRVEVKKDDTDFLTHMERIVNSISTMISKCMFSKIDSITDPETAETIKEYLTIGTQYFDIFMVGNTIEIHL